MPSSAALSRFFSISGVAMKPGPTEFTRTPPLAYSIAATFVRLIARACSVGVPKVDDLKTADGLQRDSFVTNQNYQVVFKTIVESGKLPTAEGKSALYSDRQEGRVWIQSLVFGQNLFALIEIKGLGDNKSSTEYFCISSGWQGWCRDIQSLFVDAEKISK